MNYVRIILPAVIIGLASETVLAQQDETWHPSRWGAKDQIGAANYLSADAVIHAAKLVKLGKTYALGINLSPSVPLCLPVAWI